MQLLRVAPPAPTDPQPVRASDLSSRSSVSVQPPSCSSYRASVLNGLWSRESFVFSPTRSKVRVTTVSWCRGRAPPTRMCTRASGEARPRETRRGGGTHHFPAAAPTRPTARQPLSRQTDRARSRCIREARWASRAAQSSDIWLAQPRSGKDGTRREAPRRFCEPEVAGSIPARSITANPFRQALQHSLSRSPRARAAGT